MLNNFTNKLRILVLTAVISCAFAAGNVTGWLARPVLAKQNPPEFALFSEAWNIVIDHFVDRDKINFHTMTYGAIEGMLNTLGDQNHTTFFTPEVARMQEDALGGSFEGIGAHVSMEDDEFRIVAPIRGAPAEAAGILAGDRLLAVDGIAISGMGEWEIIDRVRGPAGTDVVLTVLHPDATNAVDIRITRGRIEVKSVVWTRIPQTELAYVQITQFADDTNTELTNILRTIKDSATDAQPIRGILLDLRNNPGGYLYEAIQVGSQFLDDGLIVLHERDATGIVTTHRASGNGYARELPLVVLINEGTASAAEILAGALQENQRAQLIGATTVGTGTVLQQFTLSDGSVIRLGVTNWLTPNFNLIKNQGIQPNIAIQQASAVPLVDADALQQSMQERAWSSGDRQFNAALLLLRLATLTQTDQR